MKDRNKKFMALKIILLVLLVIILVFLTFKFFPLFKNLSSQQGQVDFKNKISDMGAFGPLMIIGLVVLQILLPFLPGEPIEILAGMCFGSIGGMVTIFIGTLISSFIVFFAVRKLGRSFIYSFFSKEKIEKFENNKFLSNARKVEMFLIIMFFIPGTPKDLFVYLGGLLKINPLKFLSISTFARFPSVISSTLAGSKFISGDFKSSIIIFIVTFLVSIVGLIVAAKIQNKITNKKLA